MSTVKVLLATLSLLCILPGAAHAEKLADDQIANWKQGAQAACNDALANVREGDIVSDKTRVCQCEDEALDTWLHETSFDDATTVTAALRERIGDKVNELFQACVTKDFIIQTTRNATSECLVSSSLRLQLQDQSGTRVRLVCGCYGSSYAQHLAELLSKTPPKTKADFDKARKVIGREAFGQCSAGSDYWDK